jgi:hypothetical protein
MASSQQVRCSTSCLRKQDGPCWCELPARDRSDQKRLGHTPVPIQLAIGSEDNFQGQIDLITMEAVYWNDADKGMFLFVVKLSLQNCKSWLKSGAATWLRLLPKPAKS